MVNSATSLVAGRAVRTKQGYIVDKPAAVVMVSTPNDSEVMQQKIDAKKQPQLDLSPKTRMQMKIDD